jgi:hypothetical protein
MNWMDEIGKVTSEFEETQRTLPLSHMLMKGVKWPDKWLPYFGGDPVKEIVDRRNWQSAPVRPPYRLTFVSTGRWMYINEYKSRWMMAFDPALLGDLIYAKGDLFTTDRVVDFKIDFRAPCMYAEKRHKDDVVALKKKWKFL